MSKMKRIQKILEEIKVHLNDLPASKRNLAANRLLVDSYIAIVNLKHLVDEALPIVQTDVDMMVDLSRFAPLPPEQQAKHDSTEYPSEKWLDDYKSLMAGNDIHGIANGEDTNP